MESGLGVLPFVFRLQAFASSILVNKGHFYFELKLLYSELFKSNRLGPIVTGGFTNRAFLKTLHLFWNVDSSLSSSILYILGIIELVLVLV